LTYFRRTSILNEFPFHGGGGNTDYDKKEQENVEYFNYLVSMITNYAKCTHEIKSRIDMAKAVFNRKMALFTSKLDINLKQKLVKCYIWSTAL
jgi:hypothetical protein